MTDTSRVRVSIVGVVVVALFSTLVGRLWFLQVGSGAEYIEAAKENSVRVVQTETPRGRILDRNGEVLVENRVVWAITASRDLEGSRLEGVLGSLSELLAIDTKELRDRFDDPRGSLFKPAVLAVGAEVREAARIVLRERGDDYPGVSVVPLTVRHYPNSTLAAHVLGYVGEINEDEMSEHEGDDYVLGDTIGRAGVEAAYEDDLRGTPQSVTVEVDPAGDVIGDALKRDPGEPGDDVVLTIDAKTQQVAEESLVAAILQARDVRNTDYEAGFATFAAPAGSVVVMDVNTGGIVAMTSFPSYDPAEFIGGISADRYRQITEDESLYQPLLNRATQGTYAPGSTFKLVTALTAMQYGYRGPDDWYTDTGSITVEDTTFHNAGGRSYGSIDLRRALTVSSDAYFFELGRQFWRTWKLEDEARGLAMQTVARELGFGEPTGFELGEAAGRIPDPEWKREFARVLWDDPQKVREHEIWYPGDQINMSVGQGDVLVTPLQLANAYATLANGGTLRVPRLSTEVRDVDGHVVRRVKARVNRQVALDPGMRQAIIDGMVAVVADPTGTAYEAFVGFPLDRVQVAGKTGTAQIGSSDDTKGDTSLFAAVFPAQAPEYVAVAVIEEAGWGSRVAAPVVRRVIEAMYDLPLSPIVVPDTEASD